MAVQVHGVGYGEEAAFSFRVLFGGAVGGDDEVDPVFFAVVLGYDGVFGVVEGGVAEVVDGWVGEVEPHGRV